jgi:hypothetical protein
MKQAIDARWVQYEESARNRTPAGGIDVTLPGRARRFGRSPPRH